MLDRADLWRVATLNIWNRTGPWERRKALICAGIAALDLDAIGLQEVLAFPGAPTQAHELAPAGWHVFHAPAWQIGGGLTFGNAILSRWPLSDGANLPLPAPDGLDTRSVCFARVDCPHGPMPLFVTHLTVQAHLSHVRCAQVRALAEHVARLAPIDDPPPVVMGDLNAEPDSDEIRFLRGLTPLGGTGVYFADCWATAEGPGHTYDRKNPYALATREPSRRIDYIFVRGPDRSYRGEPLAASLCFDEPHAGAWPSDHFGVLAEIAAARRGAHRF